MSTKIHKSAPVSPLGALARRSQRPQQEAVPVAGSADLPHQWRVALALLPKEQRLPWLLQRVTRQVLAEKFAITDESAPEYARLMRRISQAMLANPQEIKRLQQLLADDPA